MIMDDIYQKRLRMDDDVCAKRLRECGFEIPGR